MAQFFRRDFYVYRHRIGGLALNYAVLYPVLYAFCFGYIMPAVSTLSGQPVSVPMMAGGLIIFTLLSIAMQINYDLLFDLEHDRYVEYQVLLLNPRLLMLQKALFASCMVFLCQLPFYPIVVALLHSYFDLAAISWASLIIMIYAGAFFCSIFSLWLICIMKDMSKLRFVWRRCNYPLIMTGGSLIPWSIMASFSPLLGYCVLGNPMLYISEAIRQSLIGSSIYIPYSICLIMISLFCIIGMLSLFYAFKRKIDHI